MYGRRRLSPQFLALTDELEDVGGAALVIPTDSPIVISFGDFYVSGPRAGNAVDPVTP